MSEFDDAKSRLIARLTALAVPTMAPKASSGDLLLVVEHLQEFARAVDAYVLAIGREVKSRTSESINILLFHGQLTDALVGNALFQIESAAEDADVVAEQEFEPA